MRVILSKPDEIPVVVEIPDDGDGKTHADIACLEQLQKLVGGFVEPIYNCILGLAALVNEDGRRMKLPLNAFATGACGKPIVGNIVLLRDDGGKFVSVRNQDIKMLIAEKTIEQPR